MSTPVSSENIIPAGNNKVPQNYWVVNLVCLWFSQILVLAGFAALVPFIPLFITQELGITVKSEVGRAVALFSFFGSMAYAIFCPIWGKLSDRFGVKPMLLRGTFLTCFIFIPMGYVKNMAGWLSNWFPWVTAVGLLIALRFLSAACAGTSAASQVMIVRTVPDDKQGFALGSLTTSYWGGVVLGNVAGGLIIDKYGFLASFWLCGILYFIAGIAILFTRDNPIRAKAAPHRIKQHGIQNILPSFTNAVWIMMGLFLLMGTVRSLEAPYIALKIEELAGKEKAAYWTGIVSAFVGIASVISGVVSGWLSDRYSPKKILIPALTVSALALIVQGFAGSLITFAAGRSLLYIAAGGFHPVLQKVLSLVTPKRKRGVVFGFSSCMNSSGVMLAALLGGYIYMCTTINGVFYVTAAAQLLSLPVLMSLLNIAMRRPRFHRRRRS